MATSNVQPIDKCIFNCKAKQAITNKLQKCSPYELSENNKDIALEYLYDLLDNTSEWVVESGVYALGIIGDKRSIPYLETVIEGKRGKGHSGAFGWSRYIPLTKKTAKNVLEYITKEKKIPSVKSPWPPHHDWSRNEIWMD